MDENSVEVLTATQAIRMAVDLCQRVQRNLVVGDGILKSDRSPVTVADFGSQAILCKMIKERFPEDAILAEEDSKELQKREHSGTLHQVNHYVNLSIPGASPADICSWIDFGSHFVVADRYWVIDPVDGTKGFLRNDQYAIALALIENGMVKLGLLGCPNLYVKQNHSGEERGCIFCAIRGRGSIQMDKSGRARTPLTVSMVNDPKEASFTESIESDDEAAEFHQRLARRLNISKSSLKMDSQAKYGLVARGEVAFYVRVPPSLESDYKEKAWDHAAGAIIAQEAGGTVTDILVW